MLTIFYFLGISLSDNSIHILEASIANLFTTRIHVHQWTDWWTEGQMDRGTDTRMDGWADWWLTYILTKQLTDRLIDQLTDWFFSIWFISFFVFITWNKYFKRNLFKSFLSPQLIFTVLYITTEFTFTSNC